MKKLTAWRSQKEKGAGIMTVLIGSTMMLLLAFTVAGTSFHHLSMANRLDHSQTARNLAEAAIARGIAAIQVQHDLYQTPTAADTIKIPPGAPDNQCGFLTFHPGTAASFQSDNLHQTELFASLNNFGDDNVKYTGGKQVPGDCVYLRAVGLDHGVEKAMEAVLYVPQFPWALASAGNVSAHDTYVAAVKTMADADDPTKHLPANLLSNSQNTSDAMNFTGNVTITGDVQAAGGAQFNDATIKGEKRLFASQAPIPHVDITSYNTQGQAPPSNVFSGSNPTDYNRPIQGPAYCDTALTAANGLQLDGGILYVNGPLTVTGPIKGEGAIIATGGIDIQGTGTLTSNNKVAILSGGDLRLRGISEKLTLSGMLYSEGNVYTDNLRVKGNVIGADGGSTANPSMLLERTEFFYSDEKTEIQIKMPSTGGTTTTFDPGTPLGLDQANTPDTTFTLPMKIDPAQPLTPSNIQNVTFSTQLASQLDPALDPSTRFKDGSGNFEISRQTNSAYDASGNALPPGVYTARRNSTTGGFYDVAPTTSVAAITDNDMLIYVQGTLYHAGNPAEKAAAVSAARAHAKSVLEGQLGRALDATEVSILNAQLDNRLNNLVPLSYSIGEAAARLEEWASGSTGGGSTVTVTKDFSPSAFLSWAENIRVLYWREVP